MEASQVLLNNSLTFLAVSTGIIILVLGGFAIKLVIDLSKLAKNLDESTTILKSEIQPMLQEINNAVKSVNAIVQNADKRVNSVSKVFEDIFGSGTNILHKAKNISGGFIKGLVQGIVVVAKLFMRKNKEK